jgi:hypothetical protein
LEWVGVEPIRPKELLGSFDSAANYSEKGFGKSRRTGIQKSVDLKN